MTETTRLTYSVVEAGALLGLSRGAAYSAAEQNLIPVLRIGRRLVVPKVALQRMLESATVREPDDELDWLK
jgi:excisionase family DNA binding protein